MRDLGLHLGFTATRPEKETPKGPDGCWGLTPHKQCGYRAQNRDHAKTLTSSSPRQINSQAR